MNAFWNLSLHKGYVEKGTPYSLFSLTEKMRVARWEHSQILATEPTDIPAPTLILGSFLPVSADAPSSFRPWSLCFESQPRQPPTTDLLPDLIQLPPYNPSLPSVLKYPPSFLCV